MSWKIWDTWALPGGSAVKCSELWNQKGLGVGEKAGQEVAVGTESC